jgi:hypothetical protein
LRTSWIKNALVVGVILLFIGVAVQPSMATVPPEKIIVEPDVESLVAQIRIVINEILQDYGHIPIVRSLSNKILGILDSFGTLLYCIFLWILLIPLFIIVLFMTFFGFGWSYIYWELVDLLLYIAITIDLDCRTSDSKLQLNSMSNLIYECPCMQE